MSIDFYRGRASEFIVGLAVLGWIALPGAAETRLNLALGYPSGSFEARMMQRFAKNVGEHTRGELGINFLPQGRIGPEFGVLKDVVGGGIDLALVHSTLGNLVSPFKLFDLPYLVQDRQHMARLFSEIIRPSLAPEAQKRGVEVLAVIDGGFRQLSCKWPVKSPREFKGLHIRVVGSQPVASFFENFGAQPVLLSFNEVFAAARAGVINCADLPLSAVLAAKTYEVLPSITLTNHLYMPIYLVAGVTTMSKLDERSRAALFAAGQDVMMASFEEGKIAEQNDRKMLDGRARVIELNESERRVFIESSRKSYDSLAHELEGSSDLITRALKLAPRR